MAVDDAFEEFRAAWLAGEAPDPEAFMQRHPRGGEALRQRIDRFLFVAQGLQAAGRRSTRSPAGESAKDTLPAEKTIGDFKILRKIGSGGMGVVYEAEQRSLRRRVAIKVLRSRLSFLDEAVMKFRREAEAGGRQHHPGIVIVHAVGEEDGIHYIAQELVEGGRTLADRLEEQRGGQPLPPDRFREAARFINQAAEALQHAHDSGVIHRDVKPSNLLITREGRAKVTDFGLAKVENALALSRTGDLSGTPYYMSPEQAKIKPGGIDPRTDIFSLGVTLYEMLTLQRPFEGETPTEILRKIARDEPRDPRKLSPEIPHSLAWICMRAMEKNPDSRYPSMGAFSQDLERFLAGEATNARAVGPGRRIWKRFKRSPVAGLVLLVVLILAIYLPWSLLKMTGQEKQRRELLRFGDSQALAQLIQEADTLWPPYGAKIPAMEDWLERAEALVSRTALHDQALEQSTSPALKELVTGLETFSEANEGTLGRVKDRLAFSREVIVPSQEKSRAAWIEARSAIAASPRYNGLELLPQPGLVPLGPDPISGLWEFAHLASGPAAARETNGKLLPQENSGLVLVLLPGGTFHMGAFKPESATTGSRDNPDPHAERNEGPVHEVTLQPFFLAKHEMTQAQWLAWAGQNPSVYTPPRTFLGKEITLRHPVENISWTDAQRELFRVGLRLPSEAEWEYAARAGTRTIWWCGDEKQSLVHVANLIDRSYGKQMEKPDGCETWLNDGYVVHAPVDCFTANPFGLHNLYGNVNEWCEDTWHANYQGAPADGKAWVDPAVNNRIYRGGCWDNFAHVARSAKRGWDAQGAMDCGKGIRPALSLHD